MLGTGDLLRQLLRSLWIYRSFILGAVKREFESKYVKSIFGFLWVVLEPLSMILVYTLIFSSVMRARLPGLEDGWSYSIYLCAGILSWGYFADTLNRCQNLFLSNASLLKKTNFPRATLPVVILLSTTINFLIISSMLMIFLFIIDRLPGVELLYFIPLLVLQQTFALGLGVLTGTLNVFIRDVSKIVGIVLLFWFWITPIVYPISIVPEQVQILLTTFNPMAGLINFYQAILLQQTLPEATTLLPLIVLAFIFMVAGYWVFLKLSDDLVDDL